MKKTNAIDYYNAIGDTYDSGYASDYWKLEFAISLQHIIQNIPPQAHLIDIGAGTGTYTAYLKNIVKHIEAVEPASNMVKIFKQKNPDVKVHMASAEHLPFPGSTFNIAIAMGDVLSYVDDLDKALKEIRRILKPGGILIASVDNYHFFIKDVLKYGTMEDINEMKQRGLVNIGNSLMVFESRTFKHSEIPILAIQYGFRHIDMFFKLVLFDEGEHISNIEKAIDIELQLNHEICYAGQAEHIQFMWIKEGEPYEA